MTNLIFKAMKRKAINFWCKFFNVPESEAEVNEMTIKCMTEFGKLIKSKTKKPIKP